MRAGMQCALGIFLKELWTDPGKLPAFWRAGFLQDLADALEGYCQRLEVSRLTNFAQGRDASQDVNQIVRAGRQYRIHLVVGKAMALQKNVARAVHKKSDHTLLHFGSYRNSRGVVLQASSGSPDDLAERKRQFPFQNYLDDAQC